MVKVDVFKETPEQPGSANLGGRRSRRLGSTRGLSPAAGLGNGWVRVFSGLEQQQETRGTLVYLTHGTTVRDICRDLVLTEDVSIWMQVTTSLTWSRTLLKKLVAHQLVKNHPALNGTRKLNNHPLQTPPRTPILSDVSPVHVLSNDFFKVHFNIILPSAPRSVSFSFTHKYPVCISPLPRMCHMSRPFRSF